MTTEMITLKLEKQFLADLDRVVRQAGYHNRTEFIRNALREQIDKMKMKQAMLELVSLKGSSKKHITEGEYERVRRSAFEQLEKQFK